ncbi:type I restriction enzyme, S subunit [Chryseobacterium contaminans]|uniref:Type I restriction enzyme, S subunit n=1 Tax=Chryseobacterium contaminans TaxID=1423959 RepID=A0A1M6ZLA2_9FLAO|nr:restriction endonuclease subunit S [Chryseobacterium contaminans]SHL31159.1 type I restriction enzyme, S subunit [Chryseobacterium contaminans]
MRFPGFEGEWEVKKLGDIANKVNSGKTPLGGEAIYIKEGILFIRSQNVNNDKLELENSTFIPESVNSQMKNSIVKSNDILLNITGASLGRSCVVPNDFKIGNVNQHVCIIRLTQQYSPRFIQPIFSSSKGQNIFNNLQTGSGREGLNFENIKGIRLSIPNLKEQQQIASFLSLIDERIVTQNKILLHYQSLIQKLRNDIFKQKLSFKDDFGNKFPEWEICKLSDISNRITQKNSENNQNVLTISAQLGLISQLDFFNKSVSSKNVLGYYFLITNDFAYNKSYSNGYPMGAIKRLKRYEKGVVSTLYICFRFHESVSIDFMEQYFESGIQNLEIEKIAQEGARNHGLLNVGISDFFDIKINIPSIEEQKQIASFLSKIESKIQTEKAILEQLETQKKYLLQQMFV